MEVEKIEVDNMISGDWVKIDQENKATQVTFSTKNELVAKLTFDFINNKHSVEGDLSKVTGLDDNDELVETYEQCSKQILGLS